MRRWLCAVVVLGSLGFGSSAADSGDPFAEFIQTYDRFDLTQAERLDYSFPLVAGASHFGVAVDWVTGEVRPVYAPPTPKALPLNTVVGCAGVQAASAVLPWSSDPPGVQSTQTACAHQYYSFAIRSMTHLCATASTSKGCFTDAFGYDWLNGIGLVVISCLPPAGASGKDWVLDAGQSVQCAIFTAGNIGPLRFHLIYWDSICADAINTIGAGACAIERNVPPPV